MNVLFLIYKFYEYLGFNIKNIIYNIGILNTLKISSSLCFGYIIYTKFYYINNALSIIFSHNLGVVADLNVLKQMISNLAYMINISNDNINRGNVANAQFHVLNQNYLAFQTSLLQDILNNVNYSGGNSVRDSINSLTQIRESGSIHSLSSGSSGSSSWISSHGFINSMGLVIDNPDVNVANIPNTNNHLVVYNDETVRNSLNNISQLENNIPLQLRNTRLVNLVTDLQVNVSNSNVFNDINRELLSNINNSNNQTEFNNLYNSIRLVNTNYISPDDYLRNHILTANRILNNSDINNNIGVHGNWLLDSISNFFSNKLNLLPSRFGLGIGLGVMFGSVTTLSALVLSKSFYVLL